MPRALIRCIISFKEISTNALGCMNVILLLTDHRHVSATHVAIFRVVKIGIQLQLLCIRRHYTL